MPAAAAATTTATTTSSSKRQEENCIELKLWDRRVVSYDDDAITTDTTIVPPLIGWDVRSDSLLTLASGTIPFNTTTVTSCLYSDRDFDCASLRLWDIWNDASNNKQNNNHNQGMLQLRWNGAVWAHTDFSLQFNSDSPVFWFGEQCHKISNEIRQYKEGQSWVGQSLLLDVGLSTIDNATDEAVYWRVYAETSWGGKGNLLHDPYYLYYEPNTTYRTLQCIEDASWVGCTELGISKHSNISIVPGSLSVGIQGEEWQGVSYDCNDEICKDDIVFPLRNCKLNSLSAGAIVGIVLVTAVFLCCVLSCAISSCKGKGTTTPIKKNSRGEVPAPADVEKEENS